MNLVPSQRPERDIESLRSTLTALEETLRARAGEIARTKSDLGAFRIRYRREVGSLHEELDELQRAITEAEQAEKARRREHEKDGIPSSSGRRPKDAAPRFTSDAVRKLFRDVAKMIHPDLAHDEITRHRRHTLMIEANRAYALGDEGRLRRVLDAWANSPEAVLGSDAEAIRQRLLRRIAQVEEELNAGAADLAEMKESPLWKLKAMVDEASARGKDLVGDMVARLKRDIVVARNRLDAIQWRP